MNDKLPPGLLEAFHNRNLIPVVGAGVSMSLTDEAGNRIFPSWVELLKYAADELKENGEEKLANGIVPCWIWENFSKQPSTLDKVFKDHCGTNFSGNILKSH